MIFLHDRLYIMGSLTNKKDGLGTRSLFVFPLRKSLSSAWAVIFGGFIPFNSQMKDFIQYLPFLVVIPGLLQSWYSSTWPRYLIGFDALTWVNLLNEEYHPFLSEKNDKWTSQTTNNLTRLVSCVHSFITLSSSPSFFEQPIFESLT